MKPKPSLRHFLAIAGGSLLASATLHAVDFTWTGTTSGDWSTATNWNATPTFNADNSVIFDSSTSNLNTFIGSNRTIGSITFTENADTNVAIRAATAFTGGSGLTLTLGSATVAPTITVAAGATGAHSVGADGGTVLLANNLTINHNGSGLLTYRGNGTPSLSNFSITKGGSGTLRLDSGGSAFHAHLGGTIVDGGVLEFGSVPSSGIGTIRGTLTINSGATVNAGSSWALGFNATDTSYVNLININGGTLNFNATAGGGGTSANTINMTGGTIAANTAGRGFDWFGHAGNGNAVALNTLASASQSNISANLTLRVSSLGSVTFNTADGDAATDLLLSGNVVNGGGSDGGGRIIKTGAGTMVMTGTNTYNGGTTINGGVLGFANGSLGSSGNITVNGGTLRWHGTHTQDVSSRIVMQNSGSATFDTNGNNVSFASAVGSSTSSSFTKAGTGTLTLNAASTYTGATNVTGGILRAGAAAGGQAFGNGSAVTLSNTSGVNLDLNGFHQTIGSLAGGGATGGNVALGAGNLTVGGDGTSTSYAGAISGTGGLTKTGLGTLTITSTTNGYTGATNVNNGKLVVNGNISTSTLTTVASGAALGGSGTVGAATIDGILAPGNSIGTITAAGNVTWNDNDAWVFELGLADADLLAASNGSQNDFLNITGAGSDFLKGTGSSFTFDFAGTGQVGWYKLVDWTDTTNFVAGNFVPTNLGSGLSGSFTVDSGTSALYLTVIPEPGAALLGGLGLLALLRRRRTP